MKKCTKCSVEQPLNQFHKMKSGVMGVKSHCKTCTKDWFSKRVRPKQFYNPNRKRNLTAQEKLGGRLRTRLSLAIKNGRGASAVRDLGCSLNELKSYLESKFKDGMSWNNYGLAGWHIDHIIPLSKLDLSDPEQCKKACHFTNLQPLWARENLAKGNK